MRSHVKVLFVAISALLVFTGRSLAQQRSSGAPGADEGPKPTSHAYAMFRVDCSTESGLCHNLLLSNVISNPALLEKVIKVAGGTPSKENLVAAIKRVDFDFNNMPPGVCLAFVEINSFDEKLAAAAILDKFPLVLAGELQRLDPTVERELDQLNELHEQIEQLKAKFDKASRDYQSRAQLLGAAPLLTPQEAAAIAAERRQAAVALHGLQARRGAIEQRIVQVEKSVLEATADDAGIKELARAIAAREQQLERTAKLATQGTVTSSQVSEAEVALALARAELAKYRRSAAATAGGDRLAELQRRLDEATVEIAEQDAKLAHLQSATYDIKAISELESIQGDLQSLRRAIEELQTQELHQRLKAELHRRPTVNIIVGPPEPKSTTEK